MATVCTIAGDGDLYGPGVRIGLYLQWAAGFVLRHHGSWAKVSTVRVASNTICSALALTTAIKTAKGDALALDYLIVYYLTVALFYAESYNLKTAETTADTDSLASTEKILRLFPNAPLIFQNVLFAAQSFFGAWFWITGLDHQPPSTCAEQAALLGLFPLRDLAWRRFAVTMALLTGVIFTAILGVHLVELRKGLQTGPVLTAVYIRPFYYLRMFSVNPRGPRSSYTRRSGAGLISLLQYILRPDAPRLDKKSFKSASCTLRVAHYFFIYIAGPLIAIVSVERMISANQIINPSIPTSSGQMIALLSGIIATVVALWELVGAKYILPAPGTDSVRPDLWTGFGRRRSSSDNSRRISRSASRETWTTSNVQGIADPSSTQGLVDSNVNSISLDMRGCYI